MKRMTQYITILTLGVTISCGCKKYLDAKPDAALAIPTTVDVLQGLLDNAAYMNQTGSDIPEIAADNYYNTDQNYARLPNQDGRDLYIWKQQLFQDDWTSEYNVVYNANLIFDYLPKIERTAGNANVWDNCKGSAYLYRGKAFFEIAQIWAKAYSSNASQDLGIPLKLTSDFNQTSKRASVADTYAQIISDFKNSIALLPVIPISQFRPSKPVAYAFLARTYLSMRDYKNAKVYADSCLLLQPKLLDYNSITSTSTFPFSQVQYTNTEHLMYSYCALRWLNTYLNYGNVDSTLYKTYSDNDLRKTLYFIRNSTGYGYRGSYAGYPSPDNGISTDEIYLIRAECEARNGDIQSSLSDINLLLKNRYKTGTFTPVNISDSQTLKDFILTERRKELCFRELRWGDIKRLNLEGANISITRHINGQTYVLPPNDNRFALPIPSNVIQLSGIQQNPN